MGETYQTTNDGYRYLLCCIDIWSRYARVAPLKGKSADEVLTQLKKEYACHSMSLETTAPRE